MTAFLIYLLKITICSGILYSYYRLALYNRLFHQWNRFYLLTAVLISLVAPLVQIQVSAPSSQANNQVIRLLSVVPSNSDFLHEGNASANKGIDLLTGASVLYMVISAVMLFLLLSGLVRLWKLYRAHPKQKLNGIHLIQTHEKDAPFSFFRNIFWNTEIDISSPSGNRILHHEVAHVREMHSADRLLMNIVLLFFWSNPFYWIIRREISVVHEFIADQKTIGDDDLATFSQMILYAAFPRYEFRVTSNFSSSSIKRRILMLTKPQNPTLRYLSRLLILPVFVILFAAFAFRAKNQPGNNDPNILTATDKTFTVVIDAGHGGDAAGAVAGDGTTEKELNLAISRKILQHNTNKNIRILLTREADVSQGVRERVDWVVQKQPDAFISVHVSAGPESPSGFELVVTKKSSEYAKQSQLFGTLVSQELRKIYQVAPELTKGADKGIWVLDAPSISYPALLIECGNLNDQKDLAFLKNSINQDRIADQILKAIELFAGSKSDHAFSAVKDSPSNPEAFIAKKDNLSDTTPAPARGNPYVVFPGKDDTIVSYNISYKNKEQKTEKILFTEGTTMTADSVNIESFDHAWDSTLIIANGVAVDGISEIIENNIVEVRMGKAVNSNQYKYVMVLSNKRRGIDQQ